MLYELKMMLDLRFGNGFYDQIQAEYQKRLKEQKELERQEKIRKANLSKIVSEETKIKISQSKKGKPQSENQKEVIKMLSQKVRGTKWWNDGQINKRSVECPGDGWEMGRVRVS